MLKLATIFTDHMVLQANKPIKIFGEGEGEGEIEFLGARYKAYATGNSWCVSLPEQKYGGPYELTLVSEGNTIKLSDIYIGEVWFAGGQSNMEMPLFRVDDGLEMARHAENNLIRFFRVPRQFKKNTPTHGSHFVKTEDIDTPWRLCNELEASLASAVGYEVVRRVQEALGCAVGLIECNWGARTIETFIDKKYFYEYDFLRPQIEAYNKALSELDRDAYEREIDEILKKREQIYKNHPDMLELLKRRGVQGSVWCEGEQMPEPAYGPYYLDCPGTLYESMVSKLVPFAMQGVLWYQGESNDAKDYAKKYLVFMKCFREAFENKELSFYATELAPFEYDGKDDALVTDPNNWGFKREQQMLATEVGENNYLVTTMQIGDMFDIHPMRKLELGRRMALKVLKYSYGFDIDADQPTYKSATFEENKVTIELNHARGLFTRHGWVFKIYAGDENGSLERVEAQIVDDKIVLNTKMKKPTLVRFAFQMHYNGMAPFNDAGLPLSPFRTDGRDELKAELIREDIK